jgi:hypothetical protein
MLPSLKSQIFFIGCQPLLFASGRFPIEVSAQTLEIVSDFLEHGHGNMAKGAVRVLYLRARPDLGTGNNRRGIRGNRLVLGLGVQSI